MFNDWQNFKAFLLQSPDNGNDARFQMFCFICCWTGLMIVWWRLRWHHRFNYYYQFYDNEFWLFHSIWLQWVLSIRPHIMKFIQFISALFDKQSSRLRSIHFFSLSFSLSSFDNNELKWSCFFSGWKKKVHIYEWRRLDGFKLNWKVSFSTEQKKNWVGKRKYKL